MGERRGKRLSERGGVREVGRKEGKRKEKRGEEIGGKESMNKTGRLRCRGKYGTGGEKAGAYTHRTLQAIQSMWVSEVVVVGQ